MPTETTNSNSLFSSVLGALPVVGSLAEGVFNTIQQSNTNKQNQQNMMMQRQWSIDDWNRNNAYNTPAAQMARFKAAGLNPNLIYGQTNTAAPVRSTDTARLQAPQLNVASSMLQGFLSMYDLQKTQAQTEMIKAQTDNVRAQKELITNKTYLSDNAVRVSDESLDSQIEFAKGRSKQQAADIAKKQADTQFTLDQNERNRLLTAQSLTKGVEQILQYRLQNAKLGVEKMMIQQQITNLQQDNRIKKFEEQLNKYGFTRTDDVKIRLAAKILQMTQE